MLSMLSKLFEEISFESSLLFTLIFSIVGSIVLIILLVLALKEKFNLTFGFIICLVICYIAVQLWTICINKNKDITYETYQTNIENGYTVYLDGEKVSHPDKIILDGYKVEFDDEDKEILLHKTDK